MNDDDPSVWEARCSRCGHWATEHDATEFMKPCGMDGCTCPDYVYHGSMGTKGAEV